MGKDRSWIWEEDSREYFNEKKCWIIDKMCEEYCHWPYVLENDEELRAKCYGCPMENEMQML